MYIYALTSMKEKYVAAFMQFSKYNLNKCVLSSIISTNICRVYHRKPIINNAAARRAVRGGRARAGNQQLYGAAFDTLSSACHQ